MTFKEPKKSKKNKKSSLSKRRDILIQNILKSKKSVIPDTIEKCDSLNENMPVDLNQIIDSQEISKITKESKPISNCKCSLELKIVARKIYQIILKQIQIKRKRLIRFKQLRKRRRARFQNKETNTTGEVVVFVDKGTNTSNEMHNSTNSIHRTNSVISVIFEDNEVNVELSEHVSPQRTSVDHLIEDIVAKATLKSNKNMTKSKKRKHKKLKKILTNVKNSTKSGSSSSLEIDTRRIHIVKAQIHSIPKISNRLSEYTIQSNEEIPKNDVKLVSNTIQKNLQYSDDFIPDSVLSNTFYFTENINKDIINPVLSDQANKNVEKCVKENNNLNQENAEKLISDVSPDLARCAPAESTAVKELFHIKMKSGSRKSKKQPKINEIYSVKQRSLEVAKKIKRKDFSHQIHRAPHPFNTQCSSSSLSSSECNEKSQQYQPNEITVFPKLDDLTLNEHQDTTSPNIELPKYTKLKIIARKREKTGRKLLYDKENEFNYENEGIFGKRTVGHKQFKDDSDENLVIDNNSVMHTKDILRKNTQLINKNAAYRKRKELLKGRYPYSPIDVVDKSFRQRLKRRSPNSPTDVVDKGFRQRTYSANDLDKTMYSMQSSVESLPYNQANESLYFNEADEYQQIVSSTQFVHYNNCDFAPLSNILSPITYK